MSERAALGSPMGALTLEEPGASPPARGPLRCGPCAVWPRQQTWLCAVPLVMGCVGLALSLVLLRWIVAGSVPDYVPTDLVDAKGAGPDPFFLSRPSAAPKGPDASTAGPTAGGTDAAPRTRPSNHTAAASGGAGNRAPHLHNRAGARATGPTGAPRPVPPGARDGKAGGGRGGGHLGRTGPTSAASTTAAASSTARAPPPAATASPPSKPTPRWSHGRSSKPTRPTRPHHRFRTVAPTSPTLRTEHFKPCQDSQELAFCLNDGECFVIETVAGVHRHCRCKEGYHGLRCDQFVPKTDSILSDPTDELGIEFMESGETYQRQVLSIFSIAMGISLLGVACMALYCRNKRQREKHSAHLTESRNLRECSVNASGLMSKSSPRLQSGLQLQKCCKPHGSSPPQGGSLASGPSTASPPSQSRASPTGKRFRSCSLSFSPAQRHKVANQRAALRWTPPISRGRNNLVGGTRDSGHTYRHLQEVESTEVEVEYLNGCQSQTDGDHQRGAFLNMQAVVPALSRVRAGRADVPCTRLDRGTASPPPTLRARSVPIIPSVQGQDFGEGCVEGAGTTPPGEEGAPASRTLASSETDLGSAESRSRELASPPEAAPGSGAESTSAAASGPGAGPSRVDAVVSTADPGSDAGPSRADALVAAADPGSDAGPSRADALVAAADPGSDAGPGRADALSAADPGSDAGSSRVDTVVSITVLGSGGQTTQYTARLLSTATVVRRQDGGQARPREGLGVGPRAPLAGGEKECFLSAAARGVAYPTLPRS